MEATSGGGTTKRLLRGVPPRSGPSGPATPRTRPWNLRAALPAADRTTLLASDGLSKIGRVKVTTTLESPTSVRAYQAHKSALESTRLAEAGLPVSHGLPAAGTGLRLCGRPSSYPELARNLSHALTAVVQLSCDPGRFSPLEFGAAAEHSHQQVAELPTAPSLLAAHTDIPAQTPVL